jgi:hypothetical protein
VSNKNKGALSVLLASSSEFVDPAVFFQIVLLSCPILNHTFAVFIAANQFMQTGINALCANSLVQIRLV